ncbi:MAG: DUF2207 domain-containing protein [Christensenella sp.]|uniref:DUF2207 domain-containing protein n=1 Tax=Christensenella sp. TaxID=1935934 RepID=UPI002B21B62C|nr:DUF2207 domain-containing protein [Christensenella sp.]MEA5001951.1 DUF2207 domain-containing protein [Christensenella sp.]
MMKKWIVLFAVVLAMLIPSFASAADTNLEILDYSREITVRENNVYEIRDTMTVDFIAQGQHGLRVDIPTRSEVVRISNGQKYTNTYNLKVTDIYADGQFDTEKEGDMISLYIGDPDETVSGVHTYEYGYTMDAGDDGTTAFDEFYFNLIDSKWAAPINHFSFTIHMPKEFDASKVGFTTGQKGNTGYNQDAVKYKVDGTTISGEITQTVAPYESFTIRLELPQGYYVGVRTAADGIMPCIYASIAIFALVLVLVFTSGKRKKEIRTVEFNPPEGMNSADVGFIIDGSVESRDVVSLLIYWADQGNISIIQEDEKKLAFEKLQELPATANDYEHILFDKMFEAGNKISITDMQYKFSATVTAASARIKDKYQMPENRVFTKKSLGLTQLVSLLAPLPAAIMLGSATYAESFELLLGILTGVIAWVVGWALTSMLCSNMHRLKSEKLATKTSLMIGCVIGLLIYFAFVFLLSLELFGLWLIVPAGCSLVMMLLAPTLRRRTEKGAQWAGRILGLKHFIETVEAEKLKMLVESDPQYFYHILPYAYVLGVTDKWAKQFESIAVEPPSWYYGYNGSLFTTIWFASMLNNSLYYTQQQMVMTQNSGGSGFGGGIGGGGGFGGGGFSGGGIGGGGGGSW